MKTKETTSETYNKDWTEYYQYLEQLRESGRTNMYGATPYLEQEFDLGRREGGPILASWMQNYDALIKDGVIEREN